MSPFRRIFPIYVALHIACCVLLGLPASAQPYVVTSNVGEKLDSLARRHPNLKELTILQAEKLPDNCLSKLKQFPRLEHLELHAPLTGFNQIPLDLPATLDTLWISGPVALSTVPNLRVLIIGGGVLTPSFFQSLHAPNLEQLTMMAISCDFETLKLVSSFPQLKKFEVGQFDLTCEQRTILRTLTRAKVTSDIVPPSVETLLLQGSKITGCAYCRALNLPRLTELRFGADALTQSFVHGLSAPQLEAVDLWNVHAEPGAIAALEKFANLRELVVSKVTSNTLDAELDLLKRKMPRLKVVKVIDYSKINKRPDAAGPAAVP